MIVRAGVELWIWRDEDGTLTLELPSVTREGVGQPGALESSPAHIIRPGQSLGLIMAMPAARPAHDPSCQGCVDILFGLAPKDGIAHQHHHGRRPQ